MDREIIRWHLPTFSRALSWSPKLSKDRHEDERMHLLATLLALYPTADTKDMSKEFCMSEQSICKIAQYYGVQKSREKRKEINRRNGDNPRSRRALFYKINIKQKEKWKFKEESLDCCPSDRV